MATRITPPLLAKGKYVLKPPFSLDPELSYQCIALRKFADVVNDGEDVFQTYYDPNGLDAATYDRDRQLGAVIVTLLNDYGEFVYVPDTYISKYPDLNTPDYQHVVLMVSLGIIPYHLDLSAVKADISGVVSERLGLEAPEVKEGVAATRRTLTQTEADTLESARQAAITNLQTERARRIQAESENVALRQKVDRMSQVLIDKGVATQIP